MKLVTRIKICRFLKNEESNVLIKKQGTKIINFLKVGDEIFQLKNMRTKIIDLRK